ncbi:Hypothetical predicted protein [Paramuricea clavata]|uniref:Uncharacterized protein n=1 Tax=Paramuricea clavata TaxID=317549 RepID=A0A7D9D633_PARCT|nr:Hypothetical predicted protein [Paramuricea clavata]
MKQLLLEYNYSHDQLKEETKRSFQELNLDLINLDHVESEVTAILLSIKRHTIKMLLTLFKRSKEEKAILSGDIKQLFYYYRNDESNVSNRINMISSNDVLNRYESGSLALLKAQQKILQQCVLHIHDSFRNLVELPDVNYSFKADTGEVMSDNESVHTRSFKET